MTWIIQLMIAIFMIVLYISISKELRINSNILDKQLIHSLGLGMFSSLLFIFGYINIVLIIQLSIGEL